MEALAQTLQCSLQLAPNTTRVQRAPLSPPLSVRCRSAASSLTGASLSLPAPSCLRAKAIASRTTSASPRAQVSDGATLEDDEVEVQQSAVTRKYPPFAAFRIHGTGRRKTAVARVALIEGDGTIIVNGIPLNEYFQNQALLIQAVKLPLSSLGYLSKYDVVMKAHGGGLSAQAQAMVLGIARALVEVNAANKPPLKAQGMLTRDSRAVERKKYGLKKARRAPQYSKR